MPMYPRLSKMRQMPLIFVRLAEDISVSNRFASWGRTIAQQELMTFMFLRFYRRSLKRSWLQDPQNACGDAINRMSVPIAGPLEFTGASLIYLFEKITRVHWGGSTAG